MTKYWDVPPSEHGAFFGNAKEWLDAARAAAGRGAYGVAVTLSADSAIYAVDAMTILLAGKRSARRHADALDLARSMLADEDHAGLERRYRSLLSMKIPAEYEGKVMTARQASDALGWAEQIMDRVRAEIERPGHVPRSRAPRRDPARPLHSTMR